MLAQPNRVLCHRYPVITYNTWRAYGDLRIIDHHWPGLVALADYWARQPCAQTHNVSLCNGLGDWVDTLWPVENTDSALTSAFYNTLSVAYMSEIATALGRSAEAEKYAEQFDVSSLQRAPELPHIRQLLQLMAQRRDQQDHPDSLHYGTGAQHGRPPLKDIRIIAAEVSAVAANLVTSINSNNNHTTSGIVGETFVFDVLVAHGYSGWRWRCC